MTIEQIIKKYNIRIANDTQLACDKSISKSKDDLAFVREHKDEIISFIVQQLKEKQKAQEERRVKIAAIEGLEEIRAAKRDIENWNYEFNRSFSDVGGLGVRKKPTYNFNELYAKYPRAAAYLKAEEYENASHYFKASIGKKAKERIINGEDYATVIEEMEAEWTNYCDEHVFD